MRLRDVNWLGEEPLEVFVVAAREIFVKVRSTRPPQPAWLRPSSAAVEVELVDGEDGVSPGQACVFYDAPAGQARVLGGGFIATAAAAETATRAPALAAARAAQG
jgi:tRNA-specific 2-thiouridylase